MIEQPDAGSIAIGVIRRPHGVRGAIKVFSFSGETEHFTALTEVELRGDSVRRVMKVASVEIQNSVPVIHLEGVNNPEDARALAGCELWVGREHAAPLRPEEYYVTELVGMCVVVGTAPVGRIVAVADGAQAPLLEVDLGDRTALVPFMEPFVDVPDRATRQLELMTPWVLDTE